MSELIDVACDICGQQYRWGRERVGSSTLCRECGTKFDVAEYSPPTDEDAAGNRPLLWIRGAGVAALVVAAVVGLGTLPFVRPSPAAAVVAQNNNRFAAANSSVPALQAPMVPQMPQNQFNDVEQRVKALREQSTLPKRDDPGISIPVVPIPGGPRISGPGTSGPGDSGPGNPGPSFPGSLPPFPKRPMGPARRGRGPPNIPFPGVPSVPGNGTPLAAEKRGISTGVPPEVSGWSSAAAGPGRKQLRLTGRGLKNVTKVQELLGLALMDTRFTPVSDTELQIPSAILQNSGQALFAVTSADGVAVVFSDEIKEVDSNESLDHVPGAAPVCLVKKGGSVSSNRPAIVLVETGGRVNISSFTPIGFLKQDSELETMTVNALIAEEGAKVNQKIGSAAGHGRHAVVTFCRLPRLPDGR